LAPVAALSCIRCCRSTTLRLSLCARQNGLRSMEGIEGAKRALAHGNDPSIEPNSYHAAHLHRLRRLRDAGRRRTSAFSRKEQYHILNLAHNYSLCSHAGNDTHLAERAEREDVLKGEHIPFDVSAHGNGSSTV
jgi:hypothetical protein